MIIFRATLTKHRLTRSLFNLLGNIRINFLSCEKRLRTLNRIKNFVLILRLN